MSTSSLAAVASRINERNNALRSELTTLELLRSEEEELGKVLLTEESSTREVRKQLPVLCVGKENKPLRLTFTLPLHLHRCDKNY